MSLKDPPVPGDYVLASKYNDGDPGDQWSVGFFYGFLEKVTSDRYMVIDNDGNQFRGNGFRRCRKISTKRGRWLVERATRINDLMLRGCRRSIWGWAKWPMNKEIQ